MRTFIDPYSVAVNVPPVADVSTGSCPGTNAVMLLINWAVLHTVIEAAESKINILPTAPSATESTSGIIIQSSRHRTSNGGEAHGDLVGGISTTTTGICSLIGSCATELDMTELRYRWGGCMKPYGITDNCTCLDPWRSITRVYLGLGAAASTTCSSTFLSSSSLSVGDDDIELQFDSSSDGDRELRMILAP